MNTTTSTLAPLGSPRTSALALLTRVRVLVLALALLAGGFAALAPHAAQEASAAGGCAVGAAVKYSVSGGAYYMYGAGSSACGYNASQKITVSLYANGYWQASGVISAYASSLAKSTTAVWGSCGVRYQVATTHAVSGYYNTTTWSPGFYLC